MRRRSERSGISVHAVAGLHVVTLGFNTTTQSARRNLLGFALHRTDHSEDEAYWLRGFKTFQSVEPEPVASEIYSTREHPVQTFLWGDFTAKPRHSYTYQVVPLYGDPTHPEEGDPVSVRVRTAREDQGSHRMYFNRGVAGSQAYVRKFGNRDPEDVPGHRAFEWLSRGLEEGLLAFIARARNSAWGLRAAVYEFNYDPVLDAFRAAADRGVDVHIVYDSRQEQPKTTSDRAIRRADIRDLVTRRRAGKSYIAHNKFIVLLHRGTPVAVWTGSTNITQGGIFGQANLGHAVFLKSVAAQYFAYWEQLAEDPTPAELRVWTEQHTPVPDDLPPRGTRVLFSPRGSLEALEWYAERLAQAGRSAMLTAAFGVNSKLADVLAEDEPILRYLLLERRGNNYDLYTQDRDVRVSIGSHLRQDTLRRWARERLTNFNVHVRYIHTKFMLIDPLSEDPIVISGSANFSDASTKENDENMLVIRGNKHVADVYLGEFMRLFNHFYFRYHANRLSRVGSAAAGGAFLHEDDSWTQRYYQPGSVKQKQRVLFA